MPLRRRLADVEPYLVQHGARVQRQRLEAGHELTSTDIKLATDWLQALHKHLSLRRPIVDLTWTTLTGTTNSLYDDLAEILG